MKQTILDDILAKMASLVQPVYLADQAQMYQPSEGIFSKPNPFFFLKKRVFLEVVLFLFTPILIFVSFPGGASFGIAAIGFQS